jgi:hypothetical protein
MRSVSSVVTLKRCAWSLLAITAVLLSLILYEDRPRPAVGLDSMPTRPQPANVAKWAIVGTFALGSVATWAVVASRVETLRVNVFVLVVAVLYCALAVPVFAHHCIYVAGGRYYLPPAWVFTAFFGTVAFGWLTGIPLLVRTRHRRLQAS